ncbi:Glycerol-3-phosphate regulon repressor [Pseudovibrio axinellae]|uniref:Glycerol-3-phosphate regulon repressor n=1 Tax=Pseudovibrio axinellae TaxID=989403 RepID=A0A165Z712_9HYPH|nr:DeoR/GlpR family DNA-binding transcription regulator [Pseudovibrio axinellae]KZL19566.1 Glycerol-3-phosphate regulon repressor [Pseudovibrio axinellae]SEQ32324.1 transcriptional regulator, DeoR family [Pseudovibrio axinellae]
MEAVLSTRQSEIISLVRSRGFASVESLSTQFEVTTQTIRRDINRLSELGLLRRVHGGVEVPPNRGNITYKARKILNLDAKNAIALSVANYIDDGATLAFSIGTTPEIVAEALEGHEALKIFTNNINVAITALRNTSNEVSITGGRLRHGDLDVLGSNAEAFFRSYKFDIGIFGVAGVDADGTLLDFNEDEAAARQAIMANCRQSFLVVDRSKFGRQAHVRSGSLTDVTKIFCEENPPAAILAIIETSPAELVVCKQESGL